MIEDNMPFLFYMFYLWLDYSLPVKSCLVFQRLVRFFPTFVDMGKILNEDLVVSDDILEYNVIISAVHLADDMVANGDVVGEEFVVSGNVLEDTSFVSFDPLGDDFVVHGDVVWIVVEDCVVSGDVLRVDSSDPSETSCIGTIDTCIELEVLYSLSYNPHS